MAWGSGAGRLRVSRFLRFWKTGLSVHEDGPVAWTVGGSLRLFFLRPETAAGGRGLGNVPGTGNRYAPGCVLAEISRR